MLRKNLVAIGLVAVLASGAAAGDRNQGGALNMSSMDVFDYKSVIIHDNKGGTTIGSYDQTTGNFQLHGPKNEITIGTVDGWGNMTIVEHGGEDDDD